MPPGDPDTRRGVTLTVPTRAHVPHALFIPGARAGGVAGRVQSRGDPPAAVSWRSGRGQSPKKYGPRLIAGLSPLAG